MLTNFPCPITESKLILGIKSQVSLFIAIGGSFANGVQRQPSSYLLKGVGQTLSTIQVILYDFYESKVQEEESYCSYWLKHQLRQHCMECLSLQCWRCLIYVEKIMLQKSLYLKVLPDFWHAQNEKQYLSKSIFMCHINHSLPWMYYFVKISAFINDKATSFTISHKYCPPTSIKATANGN